MGEMMTKRIFIERKPTSNVHLLLTSSGARAGKTKRIAHNQNLISYVNSRYDKVSERLFIAQN